MREREGKGGRKREVEGEGGRERERIGGKTEGEREAEVKVGREGDIWRVGEKNGGGKNVPNIYFGSVVNSHFI